MNLSTILSAVARAQPTRPAITSADCILDYGGLEDQVARIAGALQQRHGLVPGDRVALIMENCGAFYPLLYGAWRAGLAAVPINAKLHPREFAWILDNSGAKLAVVSPAIAADMGQLNAHVWPETIVTGSADHSALLAAAPMERGPAASDAVAWLFYTSGTTGRPKGALLTHRNLLFACQAYYADIDFLDARDTILHAAPLTHGSGLYGLAHLSRGAHNVVLDHFDPAAVFAAFSAHDAVSLFAAPTMVTRLLDHTGAGEADTSGLKTIVYGGAPMYLADLKRALGRFGPRLYNLYGQGESPMTITGLPKTWHVARTDRAADDARLASAGVARTGCAVRVVDDEGRDVATGDVGEIITASDCVMAGYWENAAANRAALRDGCLWTGDLGSFDEHGLLTLKDRSKDLIISGGSNIYPREIEEVLLLADGVAECAVVGHPHPDWGEEVVAFIVAKPEADVDAAVLDSTCLQHIARFKRPKRYRFVDRLPKNNYGKILKTELREQLAHGPAESSIRKGPPA